MNLQNLKRLENDEFLQQDCRRPKDLEDWKNVLLRL